MLNTRRNPSALLITFLALAAVACQLSNLSPAPVEADKDVLVRDAVATVRAQLPETNPINNEVVVPEESAAVEAEQDLQARLIEVYKRINPSVVHIFVSSNSFDRIIGSGSGFVFDSSGYIVTNNHVVTDGDSFEVAFADGSRREATLVGNDIDSDLAVIQVSSLPPGVLAVPMSDSSELAVGQFVIAIGNPFGEEGSMSIGIISGLGRTLESQRILENGGRYSLPEVIQTDAAINPGNSGGPLLDLGGRVIGVNSSILTQNGTNSGVGFSIPVNAVKRIVPELIANGRYIYPYIGISMANPLDLETQQEWGVPSSAGVYVTSVAPNTPADAAGMEGNLGPGGDFIVAVDGRDVKDSTDLISYLVYETVVGQTVEFSVIRDEEEIVIPLTLGARP